MKTIFEWGVESIDEHGDVLDSEFFDNLDSALSFVVDGKKEIALVRTMFDDDKPFRRCWSYIENGFINPYFVNSGNQIICRVPGRFIEECENNGVRVDVDKL